MIWNPGEDIRNLPGVGDPADHIAAAARCMAIAAGRNPAEAGNTAVAVGRDPAEAGNMAVELGRNPAEAGNMAVALGRNDPAAAGNTAVAVGRNPAAAVRIPAPAGYPAERNPASYDPEGELKIPAWQMNRQFFDERRSRDRNEIPRQ